MHRLIFAIAGFVVGAVAGIAGTMWYLEEDFAQQQRLQMTLHGTNRAVACQQPEAQRPKNLDCRGLTR